MSKLLYSEPMALTVIEFKQKTHFSWEQIANLTGANKRTLMRYRKWEEDLDTDRLKDSYHQFKKHLALIYKAMTA
ncbi:hypothetical protein [Kamptonema sp. UHCC 0994]|uniref:hypothetical protein n=1 Tax=Kamptonema sp. UHCC 0994 TaxID=3031329 RepID=UPI0023B8D282|nr:hypothetical protein [Kamptonema sp. UHCC 0994]MDF0552205.1 hypothetical protein [Kamptonema sp. UHCC 0994]